MEHITEDKITKGHGRVLNDFMILSNTDEIYSTDSRKIGLETGVTQRGIFYTLACQIPQLLNIE
jgi:hypothetical protein